MEKYPPPAFFKQLLKGFKGIIKPLFNQSIILIGFFFLTFGHRSLGQELPQLNRFAIFALDSIKSISPLYPQGRGASAKGGNGIIFPGDSLESDTIQINNLALEIETEQDQLNNLVYDFFPNLNFHDTILSPGKYLFQGNTHIGGRLHFSSTNTTYIFTVNGDLSFDSSFIFWPDSGKVNVIWNVNGNVFINSGSVVVGKILASGNISLAGGYGEFSVFSKGKIIMPTPFMGRLKSPTKNQSVSCVTAPLFGDMIVDGGFEETIIDQNDCPNAGISSGFNHPCLLTQNLVRNWSCCEQDAFGHYGPETFNRLGKNPSVPLAPTNNGIDFSHDPTECDYMVELFEPYKPGGAFVRTTLTQNLNRSVRRGRFRISGWALFGNSGGTGQQTILIHLIGGFGQSAGFNGSPSTDCFLYDQALNPMFGFGSLDQLLNVPFQYCSVPNEFQNFNTWRYFCHEIQIQDNSNFDLGCFFDVFSINFFTPYFTGTYIGAILDNIRIQEVGEDTRSRIDNFCFGQPTSINLNTSNLVHLHATVPPNGNWFVMPGNIPITNGIFTPPSAGKYTVVYRAVENGCPFYENINFEVFPMPTANAGPDLEVCLGDGLIELNGTTPADGTWAPSAGIVVQDGLYYLDPSAVPLNYATGTNPFTYNLTLTKVLGDCSAADQLQITYHGAVGTLGGNVATCENEPITLQFQGIAAPGSIFNWSVQYDGDPGLNPSFSVSPEFILNDVPNAQGNFTMYQFTPLGSGTYTITLTISDPNAPGLNNCIIEIRNLTITVSPLSTSGMCCAKGYFVNEPATPTSGITVIANQTAAPGTQQRATLGAPNQVTLIECPSEETFVFDGEYHILGPIRLQGGAFSNFIIRENTVLYFDGEPQDLDISFMGACKGNQPKIKRPFLYLEPGTTLQIKGGTLSANCDDMWQGIIVPQGAYLYCDLGPNASRNRIEHAITGVFAVNDCNESTPWTNSLLNINNTDFSNCMVGIEDYNRLANKGEVKEIDHCTFKSNPNQMLHPFAVNEVKAPNESPDEPIDKYNGLAGIWLTKPNPGKECESPRIKNTTFESLIYGVWTQVQKTFITNGNFSYCYRAAVAQAKPDGGALVGSNYNGNITMTNSHIRVPAAGINTLAEKGYETIDGLTTNAWTITPSASVYGIKAYNTVLDVRADNLDQNAHYIKGDPNRASIKKAYGAWTRPYPAEGVQVENMYFFNLDEAIGIRRFAFDGTAIDPGTIRGNLITDNKVGVFQYTSNNSSTFTEQVPLTILQNNFSGNQTAIHLDASGPSSATDLTLKCNRFDIDNSNYAPPFFGVVLGENHRLRYDAIGGNGTQFFPKSPGANVWPIQGSPNRAIFPYLNTYNVEFQNGTVWQSPFIVVNQEEVPTWYSVKNNSTNQPIKMYRYLNEFVGRVGSDVEKANVSDRCYTDANDPLTIQPGDIHECEEGIPNPTVVVFPTRMAVDSVSGTTTGISPRENDLDNSLGQNIPNPGSSEVLIPYRLNSTCKTAVLEITQLSSGRTFEPIRLSKEETSINLDLSSFPAGVYAYTLRVDSSPVQTRKLVVVR